MTDKSFFLQNEVLKDFGHYDPGHERLQRDSWEAVEHYALTETQFFSFSIPEKKVHAYLYIWYHPNLNLISAGPLVFKGTKTCQLQAELFDFRQFMPSSHVPGDLTSFKLDNGYCVKMSPNGREFKVDYEDESRDNFIDLTITALSDGIMWPNNRHYEQVMQVTGHIVLRGERLAVDCLSVRDRTFGEARLEAPVHSPPISWSSCAFSKDFAFNVTGTDDPELNPVWKGHFQVEPGQITRFGWMIVDGRRIGVKSAKKITAYDENLMPTSQNIDIVDEKGREYRMKGTVVAGLPMYLWANMSVPLCLTKWECNGQTGHGEIQESHWTDFVRLMIERNVG